MVRGMKEGQRGHQFIIDMLRDETEKVMRRYVNVDVLLALAQREIPSTQEEIMNALPVEKKYTEANVIASLAYLEAENLIAMLSGRRYTFLPVGSALAEHLQEITSADAFAPPLTTSRR